MSKRRSKELRSIKDRLKVRTQREAISPRSPELTSAQSRPGTWGRIFVSSFSVKLSASSKTGFSRMAADVLHPLNQGGATSSCCSPLRMSVCAAWSDADVVSSSKNGGQSTRLTHPSASRKRSTVHCTKIPNSAGQRFPHLRPRRRSQSGSPQLLQKVRPHVASVAI